MTSIHSRRARGLLAGTAVAMLAALIGSAAGASELQGRYTAANHQKLEQAGEDGSGKPTTATADGRHGITTGWASASDSAVTISGNRQSAEVAGNAASTALTAKTVQADGGSYYEPTPFAVLSNRQTGAGTVKATSHMTVAVPGEISGSSVTLSDNADTALARMNDASNGVTVEAVGLSGDVLLTSSQRAASQVTAGAASRIGGGNSGSPIASSRYAIEDNSTASEATANRALNGLTATAASVSGGRTVLDNRQRNDADVHATTKAAFGVAGSGAYGSAISVEGNGASSLARGNVAENRMTVSGGVGNGDYPGGGDVPMLARESVSVPMAGAVLSNRQVNTGAVTAKTIAAAGVALNCGCTSDSRIGVTDNAGSASAYGNAALNGATITGAGQPIALVSNVQVNRGPVSATATGRFGASMTGGVNAGLVTIAGNSLAATAIGNQAVNTLVATGNLGAGSADGLR